MSHWAHTHTMMGLILATIASNLSTGQQSSWARSDGEGDDAVYRPTMQTRKLKKRIQENEIVDENRTNGCVVVVFIEVKRVHGYCFISTRSSYNRGCPIVMLVSSDSNFRDKS